MQLKLTKQLCVRKKQFSQKKESEEKRGLNFFKPRPISFWQETSQLLDLSRSHLITLVKLLIGYRKLKDFTNKIGFAKDAVCTMHGRWRDRGVCIVNVSSSDKSRILGAQKVNTITRKLDENLCQQASRRENYEPE